MLGVLMNQNYVWNQSVYCFFPSLCLCLYDLKWHVDIQMKRKEQKDLTTIKIVHHQFEINNKKSTHTGVIIRRRNRTQNSQDKMRKEDEERRSKKTHNKPSSTTNTPHSHILNGVEEEKNVPSQIFI